MQRLQQAVGSLLCGPRDLSRFGSWWKDPCRYKFQPKAGHRSRGSKTKVDSEDHDDRYLGQRKHMGAGIVSEWETEGINARIKP